jgi:hypothetical protein
MVLRRFLQKILKSADLRDDTDAVTTVIAIQGFVAALAGLLLFEARRNRGLHVDAAGWSDDTIAPIEFHPELIVRWDDEANYAHRTSCTRRPTADHVAAVRPQLAVSRSNTHIR